MKNRNPSHPLTKAITFVFTAIGGAVLSLPNSASAAATFVDSVGALNPNPSNLAIVEVGNTSLAAARILVSTAFAGGYGGVVDFQQQFQGGTFQNAPSSINGVDIATDSANPLNVTTSSTGTVGNLVASGPVVFSFYRSDAITAGSVVTNDNIDSNTNQGANIISGGYKSRDPIAAGTSVTGTVLFAPPTAPLPDGIGGTAGTSGGYMGITGAASPATLVFDTTPLGFFGITALPRGSSRDTLITLTQRPIGGGANIFVPIGTATLVTTSAVFFGQAADPGYEIIGATITNPNFGGQNRYDDLAFIAIPETSSAMLGLLGAMALLRRRRQA